MPARGAGLIMDPATVPGFLISARLNAAIVPFCGHTITFLPDSRHFGVGSLTSPSRLDFLFVYNSLTIREKTGPGFLSVPQMSRRVKKNFFAAIPYLA
jgi:hypothetical protein